MFCNRCVNTEGSDAYPKCGIPVNDLTDPPPPQVYASCLENAPLYDVQFVLDSLFNRRPRLIDAPPPPVTVLKNTRN